MDGGAIEEATWSLGKAMKAEAEALGWATGRKEMAARAPRAPAARAKTGPAGDDGSWAAVSGGDGGGGGGDGGGGGGKGAGSKLGEPRAIQGPDRAGAAPAAYGVIGGLSNLACVR